MRRLPLTLGLTLTTLVTGSFVGAPQVVQAHEPHVIAPYSPPVVSSDVSVSIEAPHSGSFFKTHGYGGSTYIEGRIGERYNIRVTNNSDERIEAVVTVDGRDVVSGEIGDYRSQRGYVLEPYGSVVIEGYRQSLDYVAAFRFADLHASYSALRGTPQNVGVIGVAVFNEARRRRAHRRVRPLTRHNWYSPYGTRGEANSAPAPAAESADASVDYGGARAQARPRRAATSKSKSAGWGGAPRPNRMGTEYGETTYSSVRETTFRRRNKRRPDSVHTIYYDSREGLRARGIPVDPPVYYSTPAPYPVPFPEAGYAPPPPRRY
ncbi:MAG TPA: hypothetical protein ENJ18_18290 [Nannocystis exedens]|nr:hypothetical protein [Nannocystis exedens]